MLEKCHRDQWKIGDLDWDKPPRKMPREDEIAIVQYFTNMAGIERLAGALFREEQRMVDDPVLQEIFGTFVVDEVRHAQAAQMLADYYDVHKYQLYSMDPALVRFTPHFVRAVRHLSPEIANVYITTGELILDVALLRSLNDFVNDDMSSEAMELINRDESRHIAIDYHMAEYYSSDEYVDSLKLRAPKPLKEQVEAWHSFSMLLWHAAPFFKKVFFEPMDLTDPSGKRIKEAFKRIQLLSTKSRVRRRPFVKFMTTLQDVYNSRWSGRLVQRAIRRITGVEPRVIQVLYDDAEMRRAQAQTFDEMAAESLGLKHAV